MFKEIAELKIGSITEVSGSSIRIDISKTISELKRAFNGKVYPIGQFASVIKIHYGRKILVAYVRRLRMHSDIIFEEGRDIPKSFEDSRIIEADLFGEGIWDSEENKFTFVRGVTNYPVPGQAVYLTTEEELSTVYGSGNSKLINNFSTSVDIGTYVGSGGTKCFADVDKLLGLHSAVLGSTGSGKSGTVAALIHSILNHKSEEGEEKLTPNIVIIDPHGEYANAFKDKCIVYKAYDDFEVNEEENVRKLKLPYWTLSGEEFRDLVIGKTEYEATSENNIVYKALEHSRLSQLGYIEESEDWIGKGIDECSNPEAPRPIAPKTMSDITGYDRDTPHPFSLIEFQNHIELEQGIKTGRGGNWENKSTSDFKSYASVLDKLTVLRNDPRLNFLMREFNEDDPDLDEIISQFVGVQEVEGSDVSLKIIDISGLPNEVAGPLSASISRLLFQYKIWQTREERERDPILIVCEEAHRYVPNTGLAEYKAAQKAIRTLAKEGRKYGIGLMLVSQRPSDVESTVLSQCNSWIVLRLSNSSDQEHVNRFLPDSLAGLSRLLPSLSRQEALFVGEASVIPARIKIRDLKQEELPKSDDISFVNGWSLDAITKENIKPIVDRWRKEDA